MPRPIALVGAATNIGIKPYEDGRARGLDRAPDALRDQQLVARLGARDLGDVVAPAYRDFTRPPGATRNEAEVAAYSRGLARQVAAASAHGAFVVVLGGDCSIVLGCLLGARQSGRAPLGLVYVDAHSDFATPEESRTGSAASMCLAMAVGRGDTSLARLAGDEPLTRASDVVLIGKRDDDEPWYGQDAMRGLPILDIPDAEMRRRGLPETAAAALERVARPELGGFWIHVDADALDPLEVPAVDSPTPGGLGVGAMAELLAPLVRHPRALGLELTIYDPNLDPDRTSAARLTALLERVLVDADRATA
jgi:arginase